MGREDEGQDGSRRRAAHPILSVAQRRLVRVVVLPVDRDVADGLERQVGRRRARLIGLVVDRLEVGRLVRASVGRKDPVEVLRVNVSSADREGEERERGERTLTPRRTWSRQTSTLSEPQPHSCVLQDSQRRSVRGPRERKRAHNALAPELVDLGRALGIEGHQLDGACRRHEQRERSRSWSSVEARGAQPGGERESELSSSMRRPAGHGLPAPAPADPLGAREEWRPRLNDALSFSDEGASSCAGLNERSQGFRAHGKQRKSSHDRLLVSPRAARAQEREGNVRCMPEARYAGGGRHRR